MRGHGIRTLGFLSIILVSMTILSSTHVPVVHATTSTGVFFDHVVIIMMENEGMKDICGGNPPPCSGTNSPYMSSLANTYGISQQYIPLVSTSDPNYYGFLGASIYNCNPSTFSGCYPTAGTIIAPNLVDRIEAAGLTWKGYMENQTKTAGCATSSQEPYEIDHNPFIFFKDITNNTSRCSKIVLANPSNCSVTDCALITDLNSSSPPNFMWLTPNDCNNMHASTVCTANKCTTGSSATCIQDGDNYLKSLVPNILNSQTFTASNNRAALFITFDEGHSGNGPCPFNGSSEDCIYSVWAGPQANSPFYSHNLYNHYSLTKTIEANWKLPKLTSNDGNATAMAEFFKQDFSLTTSPSNVAFNPGSTASFNVSVSAWNGFTSNVNLSTSTSPSSGLSVSCNPTSITGGSGTSICTLDATIAGNYTVTAIGTSGNISHNDTVKVTVSISGTVGGEIKPVDKLRLVLLFLPPGILVMVGLVAAAKILKRAKRRSL